MVMKPLHAAAVPALVVIVAGTLFQAEAERRGKLATQLERLSSCLVDQVDARAVAKDIHALVVKELRPEDKAIATSYLFDPDTGVIAFLRKTLNQKNFDEAKVSVLELVADVLTKPHVNTLPEVVLEVKKICERIFASKESSKVKVASFLPLFVIVDRKVVQLDDKVEVDKLFRTYIKGYREQVTSLSSSVKANIFELLGLIARNYPLKVKDGSAELLRYYMSALRDLFAVRGKDPDLPFVAGALNGLNHLLFTGHKFDQKDLELIYKTIRHVVKPTDELSRYNVPRAGLQLMIDHPDRFRAEFAADYLAIYTSLRAVCTHKNRDLAKLGVRAIEGFLREVAASLVSMGDDAPPSAEQCFL
ncbi:hypothetical protein BDK51DRAFT_31104, partial [Blyttiomyces helicus]